MFQINKQHFKTAVILFFVEIFIAVFIKDRFIRPFFGDFLFVIFMYFFLKSFYEISIFSAALFSLVLAYFLEILQYFNFLLHTGLEKYKIIVITLGCSFSWADMLAYTLGILFILFYEYRVFIINYLKIISLGPIL